MSRLIDSDEDREHDEDWDRDEDREHDEDWDRDEDREHDESRERDEEDCDQCSVYGEYQCPRHGEACIEAMREYSDGGRAREALAELKSVLPEFDYAAIDAAILLRFGRD